MRHCEHLGLNLILYRSISVISLFVAACFAGSVDARTSFGELSGPLKNGKSSSRRTESSGSYTSISASASCIVESYSSAYSGSINGSSAAGVHAHLAS